MATSREARKTRRTPIHDGFRSRLRVDGKDPNYEYYIVTDKDDRVRRFEEYGWEVVRDKEITIGESRISKPTDNDTVRTVSLGGGETGVLMKIQKELWEEDQLAKNKRAEATVKQIMKDAKESSDYGKITHE